MKKNFAQINKENFNRKKYSRITKKLRRKAEKVFEYFYFIPVIFLPLQ